MGTRWVPEPMRTSLTNAQMRRQWHPRRPADSIIEVGVPTVHRFGPYRFFFYVNENQASHEPPHIHVKSGNGRASFWLKPVSLRKSWGYTPAEVHRLRRIVVANRERLLRSWDEFFYPDR